MKYLYNSLLLCFIIFISLTAKSQTDIKPKGLINPSFGVNGGDIYAEHIAITNDGYTYTGGMFKNTVDFDFTADTFNLSSTYGYNMFIAKYDKQSHLVFAFKLSGLSGYDDITGITTDKEDNIYVVGFFSETIDFNPGPGTAILSTPNDYTDNMFIAKYDKNGRFIFVKPLVIGQDINHLPQINYIKTDDKENIFIAGYGKPQDIDFDPGIGVAHPESHGKDDAFFAKYDASGNYIFSKAVGSNLDDGCYGIALNKNNDIVIVGYFSSSTNDFDPNKGKVSLFYKGGVDAFVGIYDSSGNYKYAFSFGGVKDDYVSGVATDNDSNIVVSGSFYGSVDFAPDSSVEKRTSDADQDYFLAKYSSTAKLLFVTAIHADSPTGSSLAVDSNSNIYITSEFNKSVVFSATDSLVCTSGYDDFWAKYNSKGVYNFSLHQVIHKTFPSFINIALLNNNQICISSNFDSTVYFSSKKITTQDINFYIATYNTSSGNNTSANAFGTYRSFNVQSSIVKMTHDVQGNLYIAGTFQGVVDFDPGIKQYILTSSQDANSGLDGSLNYPNDIFFAKYDFTGKLIFAKDIGGTKGQSPISITVDDDHNIYLAGNFQGNTDADPGIDSAILYAKTKSHDQSYFIGKYDSLGNYVFAKPIYIDGIMSGFTIDKQRNIYIAGNFSSGYFDPLHDTSKISAPNYYIYFAKYNNEGNFIYLKKIGQQNQAQRGDALGDIKINSKGNILISGTVIGSQVDFDPGPNTYYINSGNGYALYIASYTPVGKFLFETNSTSYSGSQADGENLRTDNNDNIVICGPFNGKVKVDPRIDTVISGVIGAASYFLIKYNSSGYPVFVETITSDSYLTGSFDIESMAIDDKKNIYIGGYEYGKVDFDPGPNVAYLISNDSMHSGHNIYLAKYDSSGNYDYAYDFAPTDSFFNRDANVPDIWVNKNSEITYTVNTNGKIDFDPGPDTFYYHPPFDYYPTQNKSLSFVLVKFKQTQTVKPFTIYASTSKPDIDKTTTFNLNRLAKYLK